LCFATIFASLPGHRNLRYKEVTGNTLGDNSVSGSSIQDYSINRFNLEAESVTNAKLAPLSVTARELTPGAVTSTGLSFDLVPIVIKNFGTHLSQDENGIYYRHVKFNGEDNLPMTVTQTIFGEDNPPIHQAYIVEGKAKGPGVIIGWYPTKNGHFLRYKSATALDQFQSLIDDDVDLDVLFPVGGVGTEKFTTPVYSPTIESFWITDDGTVRMRFFGRGYEDPSIDVWDEEPIVEVTVVVLLDHQYGVSD